MQERSSKMERDKVYRDELASQVQSTNMHKMQQDFKLTDGLRGYFASELKQGAEAS